MALDPQVQYVLGLVEKAGYPEFWQLTPQGARELFDKTAPVLDAAFEEVARFEELRIPGPAGELRVNLYAPQAKGAGALPLLVYFHGGGFVIGSLESYDKLCRVLANRAGCLVASVDYRLAPEHKFPAAPDDCIAALRWLAAHAGEIGAAPARIAVGGDSAGGNLAAVTALQARDGGPKLAFQLLVYPCTGARQDEPSHFAFAEKLLLTRNNVLWFYEQYVAEEADRSDWRLAPLLAPDLAGLPPALVIVAGYDPLRDEGIAYAERLKAAGVPVELTNYEGMVHGFFSLSGAIDAGKRALEQSAAALRRAFGTA
jgi:acetyl esterase